MGVEAEHRTGGCAEARAGTAWFLPMPLKALSFLFVKIFRGSQVTGVGMSKSWGQNLEFASRLIPANPNLLFSEDFLHFCRTRPQIC